MSARNASLKPLLFLLVPMFVRAQVLVPEGPEFRVNTFTANDQDYPAVSHSPTGGFVVAWESFDQDGDRTEVFAQRYSSDGSPVGPEFHVNSTAVGYQGRSAISHSSAGEFVVVWQGLSLYGSGIDVVGQRYANGGSPLGSEFIMNSFITGPQAYPAVSHSPAGGFAVVWQSLGQDGSASGIFGQRYSSGGSPAGPEFQVNSFTTGEQLSPVVSESPAGEIAVVWASYGQDGDGFGIFGQRYSSGGAPAGPEFRINSFSTGYQRFPAVSHSPAGGFVVVWSSPGDGSDSGVFGQRYSSGGSPIGLEFQVNSITVENQHYPSISHSSAGGFAVVWESYSAGLGSEIFGQRYSSTGSRIGMEFQVNSFIMNSQSRPVVSHSPLDGFAVVWQSYGQDGSYQGVFGQRFRDERTATATPTVTPTFTVTRTSTITATRTATPSATRTSTVTPTSSVTPTFTITATRTATPSATRTFTVTPTSSVTPTFTVTATRTATPTATPTVTATSTSTPTNTTTFTVTATYTATFTVTPTSSVTPTFTITATQTATPTATPTVTATSTSTSTNTPAFTATAAYTATSTHTATRTHTNTFSATPTGIFTSTPTATPTSTATRSSTASPTASAPPTPTKTPASTSTALPQPSSTRTRTRTPRPTTTPTRTPTIGPSVTPSRTPTPLPVCPVSALKVTVPAQATACYRCGEAPDTSGCGVVVRVSAVDAAGDPVACFAGTFLIVPSDTAADRPVRLNYPFGSPDASFFYYPAVAGDQLITLRQLDGTVAIDGLPLIGQSPLTVLPNTTAGQFWVSAARGSAAAAGTHANPFDTVTTALARIPAPQQNPCIHVEAGVYNDRPVLNRRATVIGDSITGCILRGQGGDALTLGPDASGSRIRRLSLVEGVNPGDPISAGLWIYGAEDVVVSNCVIRSNGNGVRLEQTRGTLLHNNTILANRRDAVYASFAGATLNSNLIRRNFACEIFEGATDSGRSLVSLYNNFGFRILCRGFDIGPESNDDGVEFSDELNGIFDVSLDYNRLIRIVDGADPLIGLDVDRTATDRGAYGGPWGERHDIITVPTPWTWRWLTIGVLMALSLACLRSRRRN